MTKIAALLLIFIFSAAWLRPGGPSGSFTATPEAVVQQFTVESSSAGAAPFTVGLLFKEGDVAVKPSLDLANSQCTVKANWPDTSVRHAICTGRVSLTADTPLAVDVLNTPATEGTALTEADIVTAAPSASVQLGSIGTVNLSSLLGSPVRTFISGPEMVEAHYATTVTDGTNTMIVKFYVRLYADGRVWIKELVANDVFDSTQTGTTTATYVPTLQIDGSTVYNNSGASLTHYGWQAYEIAGWIGGDPGVKITHDTDYLKSTKMVANYRIRTPSDTALDGLDVSYVPLDRGPFPTAMGEVGHQAHHGPLPLWGALYITSGGDERAFNAMLTGTKSVMSFPMFFLDATTLETPKITDWADWSFHGEFLGAGGPDTGAPLYYSTAHSPHAGFLEYGLTGEYSFFEILRGMAASCYFEATTATGSGFNRKMIGQDRGIAWCVRLLAGLTALAPDNDQVTAELLVFLEQNIDVWNSDQKYTFGSGQDIQGINYAGMSSLGPFFSFSANHPLTTYGDGKIAPWMEDFEIWAQSYTLDLKILDAGSTTALESVLEKQGQMRVGMFGPAGTSNYCFTHAGAYNIDVSATDNVDPTVWYTGANAWGDVFNATFGGPNDSCTNTLVDPNPGSGAGNPTFAAGQWAMAIMSLAGLVNHDVTGAAAAWARLIGATNWSDQNVTADYASEPNYGIVPWGYEGTCCE